MGRKCKVLERRLSNVIQISKRKYIREYYAEDVEAEQLQDNGRWQVYQLKADSLK